MAKLRTLMKNDPTPCFRLSVPLSWFPNTTSIRISVAGCPGKSWPTKGEKRHGDIHIVT